MSWLRHLVWEAVPSKYPRLDADGRRRIARELDVIEEKDFPGYFLIVHGIVTALALAWLPLGIARGWGEPPATGEAIWLLGLFAASIGIEDFTAIPISGRIVCIADNFDALTTERPYKPAWSFERTVEHILGRAGTQFDPDCVAAFERALPRIQAIMEQDRREQMEEAEKTIVSANERVA